MESVWLWTAIALAGLALLQGLVIGVQCWEHRRFARSRFRSLSRQTQIHDKGRAAILVPCRGLDTAIEENLHRLYSQDYPNYEVWFIVESTGDPAYPILRRVVESHPEIQSRIVLAGAAQESGQKVHNLRAATENIPDRVEYLAFLDADARPCDHWLRAILTRIDLAQFAAATAYRWYVPTRPSLANHLLYALNGSVATLYSRNGPNFIWGGSWAIRRDRFEALGIRDAWKGTLSDDFVVSRVIRQAGLRIQFEPACMVASPVDVSPWAMLEFVRRQYVIGRFHVPFGFYLGLSLLTFANVMLLAILGAAVWAAATGAMSPWYPIGAAAMIYVTSICRGLVRGDLAKIYCPNFAEPLASAWTFDTWAGPLVGLVNWMILSMSCVGRRLTWRGITYTLTGDGRVEEIRRSDGPPQSISASQGEQTRRAA